MIEYLIATFKNDKAIFRKCDYHLTEHNGGHDLEFANKTDSTPVFVHIGYTDEIMDFLKRYPNFFKPYNINWPPQLIDLIGIQIQHYPNMVNYPIDISTITKDGLSEKRYFIERAPPKIKVIDYLKNN